jgi:hypothetical protein
MILKKFAHLRQLYFSCAWAATFCMASAFATAFTAEQTVSGWVSALKRNDVKAAMLLGTTPEEYLDLRKELASSFVDTPESNQRFAGDFADFLAPDASDRLFAQIQPHLAQVPLYSGMFAGMADSLLEELGTEDANEKLSPEQLASAREVLNALKSWAARTDFSDEKRAKSAINALVSAFRAANVKSASDWAKLSDDARVAKLNFALQAIKGITKAYDLNIDNLLGSIVVSAGKAPDQSEVRIGYKVFEARGSSMFKLYQRSGEWFFWEEFAPPEVNEAESSQSDAVKEK